MRQRPRPKTAASKGPSSFEFITITKPEDAKDKHRRTLVRKFVMKDIGRSWRRPPANPTIELILDPRCRLGSGEADPFARYPIELASVDRELVANSTAALILDEDKLIRGYEGGLCGRSPPDLA